MAKKSTTNKSVYLWATIRIALGLIFLWAFADKTFGLGFSTCRTTNTTTKVETVKVLCDKSWLKGGSPTEGFLTKSPKGPLKETYNSIAGKNFADILFMVGLLGIGGALLTGAGMKIAAATGSLLMMLMWSAVLPPASNPLIDDHVIYALVLIALALNNDAQVWGLGKWWQKQAIVKRYPILE